MFAHYFASKKTKFVVISDGPTPNGKVEARKIAKEHDAQPWNF